MNWLRVRRRIGEHPVLAVILGIVACLMSLVPLLVMAATIDMSGTVPPHRNVEPPWPITEYIIASALAGSVVGPFAVGMWTWWVACVVGRAGGDPLAVRRAVPWVGLICLGVGCFSLHPVLAIVLGVGGWIVFGYAILIGSGIADWLTRRRLECGKWEVTMPIEPPAEPKERP